MRIPFACCLLAFSLAGPARSANTNQSARDLARLLPPTPPAAKFNPDELGKLRQRMITLIEALEKSARTNGPGPESLLAKAYDYRDDVGNLERLLTSNAILAAWREAEGRGLFDEEGKYYGTVTKGRGTGQDCVFELVVPGAVYPPASNQLANLRIVPDDSKRGDDTPLGERERQFQGQLEAMMEEKERGKVLAKFENPPPTDAMGVTAAEALARWKEEMKRAGDAATEPPNLRLQGKVTGTPSRGTGYRWRVAFEVLNFSTHPTEASIDVYLIGRTWKKNDYYLMAKSSHPLHLLANEKRRFEVFTRSEASYKAKADNHDGLSKAERAESRVGFRGFVLVARHGDKVVSFTGSDQRLVEFGNPANEASVLTKLPAF